MSFTETETKTETEVEAEASKSCIGCADKFDGTAKINFPCSHEYCVKCTDKIISKSGSGNDPKCSICTPDIEEGGIEGSSRCKCCSECCKSCGGFMGEFFSCNIDLDFIAICAGLFSIGSILLTISAIVFGIVRLLEYDYDYIVRIFMIMSVIYNAIFCIIVFRTVQLLNKGIDAEHANGKVLTFLILVLIHVFFVIFGSYNLSHYFDYNKPVIVLVASSCANIIPSFFLMFAG